MRLRLVASLIGLAGMAGLTLSACGGGGSASTGSDAPVKIAALVYQTGPLAQKGADNNLRLAVDELNKAGGVAGHQVELKLYDIGGTTPQQGRTAAQKALADDPTALIGPTVSAQTNALVDLLPSAKVPLINLSAQRETDPGQPKGNEWVFRLNQRTDRESEAIARTVADTVHGKNAVVAHSTDDTTTLVKDYVVKDLQAKGVTVGQVAAYAPDATNLTNAALETRGADATVALGYPQPLALLIKQMRANGITTPVVTDYGAESIVLGHLVSGKDLNNTMFLGACEPVATQSVDPAAKTFVDNLNAQYPGSYINGYYYDAVKIIAEGVKAAGGLDPDKVRSALAGIKGYHGVCGDETADSAQNYLHSMVIVKMDGGTESYGGIIENLTGDY